MLFGPSRTFLPAFLSSLSVKVVGVFRQLDFADSKLGRNFYNPTVHGEQATAYKNGQCNFYIPVLECARFAPGSKRCGCTPSHKASGFGLRSVASWVLTPWVLKDWPNPRYPGTVARVSEFVWDFEHEVEILQVGVGRTVRHWSPLPSTLFHFLSGAGDRVKHAYGCRTNYRCYYFLPTLFLTDIYFYANLQIMSGICLSAGGMRSSTRPTRFVVLSIFMKPA